MFSKLSLLLAFVAPLVSALTLQIPQNPTSGGTVTIKWTSANGDPNTFSLELLNTVFNNAFAIANNVDPSLGEITLTLPIVPVGDGYTLEAVNIGDINDVYASTGSFSIGPTTVSLSSSSSTSASSTGSGSSTRSGSSAASVTTGSTTSSIITPSSSSSPSTTASSTSTGFATPFNTGGAMSLNIPVGSIAAIIFSAVAGAAMIAL